MSFSGLKEALSTNLLSGLLAEGEAHDSRLIPKIDPLTMCTLLVVIALSAYARLTGLFHVGLHEGDDFYYYRWSYLWLNGDFKLFGMYRIANPIVGAFAIRMFGLHDYSIHLLVALISVLNVPLVFVLSYIFTTSRFISLVIAATHTLSIRVIENDRIFIPYSITEFFFLLSCIFLLLYFKNIVDTGKSTGVKGRFIVFPACSALMLSFASHAHWEIAAYAGLVFFVLLSSPLFSRAIIFRHAVLSACAYAAGFWFPVVLGMLFFSPLAVFTGIVNVARIIQDVAEPAGFSVADILSKLFLLYKTVVYKNSSSYLLGFVFPLSLLLSLFALFKRNNFLNSYTKNFRHSFNLFIIIVLYYIAITSVTGISHILNNWHLQHLSPVILMLTACSSYIVILYLTNNRLVLANLIFVVLFAVFLYQGQPLAAFGDKFSKPTPYRTISDVLRERLNATDRALVVPYSILDDRYQFLTPPCYLNKEYVDYIYEYTSELTLDDQVNRRNIRYLVVAKALIYKHSTGAFSNALTAVGSAATLGLTYGKAVNNYNVDEELSTIARFLSNRNALPLYDANNMEIYDLRHGK